MNKELFVPGVLPSPPDERDFTIAMACRALGVQRAESLPRVLTLIL